MSSQASPEHATYDPRTVGSALWARKWSALAIVVIIVAGGMFLSYRQTPIYLSAAEVFVPAPVAAVGTGGNVTYGQVTLEDEAKIATSQEIAATTAKRMGFEGPIEKLTSSVRVGPSQGTSQVLTFEAESPDPNVAADIANTMAAVYLAKRNDAIVDGLTNKLKGVEDRLASVNKKLKRTPPEKVAEFGSLSSQSAALTATRNDLASAVQQVKSSPGYVLQEATPGTEPIKPNHPRDLIIALVAAAILAAGLAMLFESFDDKLRGTDDIEVQSGGSLLGGVPRFAAGRKGKGKRLVVLDDPRTPAAEAYRTLKTGLMFAAAQQGFRSLVVTSAEKSEGKSTTSANLAFAMAQAEERVLLIDGDLRRPSIHAVLDLPNRVGLAEVLTGRETLLSVVQKTQLPRLRALTSGAIPPNPVELLGSSAMDALLEQAMELFEWVIIDAPPALGVADASVLARKVGGVLFVVSEETSRDAVAHARDQLSKVDANIVGSVLNNLTRSSRTYYPGYGYSRSYDGYEPRREDKVMSSADAQGGMRGTPRASDEPVPSEPDAK